MREEQCDERKGGYVRRVRPVGLHLCSLLDNRSPLLCGKDLEMKTATFERGVFYATISLVIIGLTLISYVIVERIVQ